MLEIAKEEQSAEEIIAQLRESMSPPPSPRTIMLYLDALTKAERLTVDRSTSTYKATLQ